MQYFVQQLINGLTLGSIYGLIAIGYTMVYGIIGMINFAHGDIFMIGAFTALIVFLILVGVFASVPVVLCAADHDDRGDAAHQPLQLDHREGRLPAAARLVPAGAADHRHRHVDRAVQLRAGHAGPAQQADPADGQPTVYDIVGISISLKQIIIVRGDRRSAGDLLVSRQQDVARPRPARLRAGPQDGGAARHRRRPHHFDHLHHGRLRSPPSPARCS